MTLEGLRRLEDRRNELAAAREVMQARLNKVDAIRKMRMYYPNEEQYSPCPRAYAEEKYSDEIVGYKYEERILVETARAYKKALENQIVLFDSEIKRIDAIIEQANELIANLEGAA